MSEGVQTKTSASLSAAVCLDETHDRRRQRGETKIWVEHAYGLSGMSFGQPEKPRHKPGDTSPDLYKEVRAVTIGATIATSMSVPF